MTSSGLFSSLFQSAILHVHQMASITFSTLPTNLRESVCVDLINYKLNTQDPTPVSISVFLLFHWISSQGLLVRIIVAAAKCQGWWWTATPIHTPCHIGKEIDPISGHGPWLFFSIQIVFVTHIPFSNPYHVLTLCAFWWSSHRTGSMKYEAALQ